MQALSAAKNADYASDENAFANFNEAVRLGVPPSFGILIRMQDKMSRACSLHSKGDSQVTNETIRDTMMDLSIYCCIYAVAIEAEGKQNE